MAIFTECAVLDRIVEHHLPALVAEKPPPAHVIEQVAALAAADESRDHKKQVILRGEGPSLVWPPSGGRPGQ